MRAALAGGREVAGVEGGGRVVLMASEPSLDPVLILLLVDSQTLSLRLDSTHSCTSQSERRRRRSREEEVQKTGGRDKKKETRSAVR